jgi:hypothetical protein
MDCAMIHLLQRWLLWCWWVYVCNFYLLHVEFNSFSKQAFAMLYWYTNHTVQLLGPRLKHAQTKPNRKKMNVNNIKSMKTTMTHHRCALQRIPTTIFALRRTTYQKKSLGRDATTTLPPRLVLGFPWYTEGCGEGYIRRPSRRKGGSHGSQCVAV